MADELNTPGAASATFLGPFRHGAFARLWVGAAASNIGTWMEALALGIYVQRTTGSAAWTGAVAAAAFLPIAIVGPVGGALADRLPRKLLLIATSVVQAGLAASLAVLFATGSPAPLTVTLIAFGNGVCAALGFPAFQAILPDLVPIEDLPGAIALSSAQYNLGRIIGPILAGIVIGNDNFVTAEIVNGASFLVVIAMIATLPIPAPRAPTGRGFLGEFWAGFAFVRSDPGLRVNVAALALNSFLAAPFIALIPTMAEAVIGAPHGTATLVAAQGIGAVAVAVGIGPITARQGPRTVLLAMMGLLPFALAGYALSPGLAVATGSIVLVGACYLGALTTFTTVAQLRAPAALRGRILAVHTTVLGLLYPIGAVLQGRIADVVGLRETTLGAAVLLGLTVLGVHSLRPGLARALDEPPALPSAP